MNALSDDIDAIDAIDDGCTEDSDDRFNATSTCHDTHGASFWLLRSGISPS